MNIFMNTELMCLLAIIFVLLSLPMTGLVAALYGTVAILCILVILFNHITEDSDDDF